MIRRLAQEPSRLLTQLPPELARRLIIIGVLAAAAWVGFGNAPVRMLILAVGGLIGLVIAVERPTLFFSSPGFCAALLDAAPPTDTFSSVRATVTAGESLPADVQRRFAELTGSPVLDGIVDSVGVELSRARDEERGA